MAKDHVQERIFRRKADLQIQPILAMMEKDAGRFENTIQMVGPNETLTSGMTTEVVIPMPTIGIGLTHALVDPVGRWAMESKAMSKMHKWVARSHQIGSISEVVEKGLLNTFPFLLITSLDSEIEVFKSHIGTKIRDLVPSCSPLGRGLILPGQSIAKAHSTLRLFNGFDELWCFSEMPSEAMIFASIVSPVDVHIDGIPSELHGWIARTKCELGLGDGDGLNIVGDSIELHRIETALWV